MGRGQPEPGTQTQGWKWKAGHARGNHTNLAPICSLWVGFWCIHALINIRLRTPSSRKVPSRPLCCVYRFIPDGANTHTQRREKRPGFVKEVVQFGLLHRQLLRPMRLRMQNGQVADSNGAAPAHMQTGPVVLRPCKFQDLFNNLPVLGPCPAGDGVQPEVHAAPGPRLRSAPVRETV